MKLKIAGLSFVLLIVVGPFLQGCETFHDALNVINELFDDCEAKEGGSKLCDIIEKGKTYEVEYDKDGNEISRHEKK